LVFASNKDRRDPAAELHTNFKLDGDGEYLALTDPAGAVVQAFDAVPAQRTDVSWGLPATAEITPLVAAATPARALFLAPGEAAPAEFVDTDFDDAAWSPTRAAVGFDRSQIPEAAVVLNDSTANWGGVQGANGWTYGYADPTAPAYTFTPFADNGWNGNVWEIPGDPPLTELNRYGGHPNGRNQGGAQWAVRRWTANGPGRVRVRGLMGTYGIYGDGTTCRVLVDGNEVVAKHVKNDRKRYDVTVDVVPGTTVDLAIDPGIDGDANSDRTLFTARVELWDAGAADLADKVGDSVTEWSATGSQGARGWWSGYWDRGRDADDFYAPEDFLPFPRDEGPFGATDFWNGVAWDWPGGDPPWTFMDADFWHPNGEDTGDEQWPMRRWQSPVNGDLLIRWRVAKAQNGGGGVTGHVFQNGAQLDFADIAGGDLAGVERFVVAYGVQAGDVFDFALDPRGRNGSRDSGGDLSQVSAEIWRLGDLHPFISADVGRAGGDAAGVLLRVPFDVADPGAFDRLRLTMRYDDGFEAFLGGRAVAADNAAVVADRPARDALAPVQYDLTDALPTLGAGAEPAGPARPPGRGRRPPVPARAAARRPARGHGPAGRRLSARAHARRGQPAADRGCAAPRRDPLEVARGARRRSRFAPGARRAGHRAAGARHGDDAGDVRPRGDLGPLRPRRRHLGGDPVPTGVPRAARALAHRGLRRRRYADARPALPGLPGERGLVRHRDRRRDHRDEPARDALVRRPPGRRRQRSGHARARCSGPASSTTTSSSRCTGRAAAVSPNTATTSTSPATTPSRSCRTPAA
jgi:hypothetical protein